MSKRSLETNDLIRSIYLSSPNIALNGIYVALTVTRANANENKYISEIWILRTYNGDVVSVLAGKGDSIPR